MKINIIGAGLGGLTFGALAAKDGHKVTVYDKNSAPGGVVALLEHDGYKFEQGPLLVGDMLPGEPVSEFLATLGIHLPTTRADRDIIMPDYDMITPKEYGGPYWRRERLKELFPEEKDGIDAYYKFYDDVMHLRHIATQKQNLINKARLALAFMKIKKLADMSAQELVEHFFKSEKLQTLYTGILADFCAAPSEAEALAVIFTNPETAFDKRIPLDKNGKSYYPGFCYVDGGCQKMPEALADCITSHGGEIIYNTVVDKVIIENGRAKAVRLADGTIDECDMVVGCGAGRDFFFDMVGREHLDKEYLEILDTFRPMEAVFMLHLGVNFDPMEYLRAPLVYCYGMYDLEAATERLRTGIYHEGNDGYLIFVPSYHAPDFAPEGKHALTIYTVAPDTLKDGDWESKKEEYAKKLIKCAEKQLPGLSDHIETMKIMTARDYAKYTHMKKSSFGGVVPIRKQKNPSHKTPIPNLWFVGQQSENAGGLGTVILGAKSAYEKAFPNK